MKDAYSFGIDEQSLQEAYDVMHDAYCRVFTRTGLHFCVVAADSGSIGGAVSNEFHVLADSGEDAIAFSTESDFAANVELAPTPPANPELPVGEQTMTAVDTPGVTSIAELSQCLDVAASQCVKTLIVHGAENGLVALVLRGDHELNVIKAAGLAEISSPVTFAQPDEIEAALGTAPGSIGPVGLDLPVIADNALSTLADFVCGANQPEQHLTGVSWSRDLPAPKFVDLRNVVEGDPSPDGKGVLSIARGIEVGHIFQLGTKYSEALQAVCLDENGKAAPMTMGCYGIGVTRIVAAAIEQNHDERGIIWPSAIAPFHVVLLPMNMHKSMRLKEAVDKLYRELEAADLQVLLDDRQIRAGVMFADAELVGVPHRVVIGDRGLDKGSVEYKNRQGTVEKEIPIDDVVPFLRDQVRSEINL